MEKLLTTIDDVIQTAPTRRASTLLRFHEGAFHAPRANGTVHQGVDIVAILSSPDKSTYEVYATADGVVAYAMINGSAIGGYGRTVIIDHANGWYTLYAHLAINASTGVVNLGDAVTAGQVLGYLADLGNGEMSSGNARAVAPYDRIQLHFECFPAPAGRSSNGDINHSIRTTLDTEDPTARLTALGYEHF